MLFKKHTHLSLNYSKKWLWRQTYKFTKKWSQQYDVTVENMIFLKCNRFREAFRMILRFKKFPQNDKKAIWLYFLDITHSPFFHWRNACNGLYGSGQKIWSPRSWRFKSHKPYHRWRNRPFLKLASPGFHWIKLGIGFRGVLGHRAESYEGDDFFCFKKGGLGISCFQDMTEW